MTLIYLAVIAAVVGWAFAARRDLFSPFRIFVLAYATNLAIDSLQLSRYQAGWSSTTHLLFWGSASLFVCGCFISWQMLKIAAPGISTEPRSIRSALAEDARAIDWPGFLGVYYGVAAFFLFGYVLAWAKIGTIPVLATHPDWVRVEFITASRISNASWFFGPMALMLGAEALLFGQLATVKRVKIILVASIVLVAYLTYLTRVDLFRAFIFCALMYHYGKSELTVRQMAVLGSGAVAFFILFAVVRAGTDTMAYITGAAGVKLPAKYMWFAQPYAYVVGNLWNMDFAFRQYVDGYRYYPMEWGFELLRPFLGFIGLEGAFTESYGLDGVFGESIARFDVNNSTNYVWHLYKDFGVVGLCVQSLLFGFALSTFYYNMFVRPTLLRMTLWALIAGLVAFSVTTAFWTMWFVYMNMLVLIVAHGRISLGGVHANPDHGELIGSGAS